MTLVEILIALVVLALGILAFAKLLPQGSRSALKSRMATTATQYANDSFEDLRGLPATDPKLSLGRHPASGFDSLGTSKAWRRTYEVSSMASPLNSLLKLDVVVRWRLDKPDSIRVVGYLPP